MTSISARVAKGLVGREYTINPIPITRTDRKSDRLPSDVQDAVCSEGIRIDDYLYDGGWDDGSW